MYSCLLSIGKLCTIVKFFDSCAANDGSRCGTKGDTAGIRARSRRGGFSRSARINGRHISRAGPRCPQTSPLGWTNRAREPLIQNTVGAAPIAVLQVPHFGIPALPKPPAVVRQRRQVPTPMWVLQIVEILYTHSIFEIFENGNNNTFHIVIFMA